MEKSYVMVKPEFANYKWIIDEIKNRLTNAGINILKEGYARYDKKAAKEHYIEHIAKPFYPELEEYLTSDKVYGMIVEGEDAIKRIRMIVNGPEKQPSVGSIRYDIPKKMGRELDISKNVVHASDKPESAENEAKIFEKLLNR